MSRGFTVVEILVTLVIMTVLLTLGVVGMRSTLANARDAERQEDISVLARGFELYYKRGLNGNTQGSYPSYNEFWNGAVMAGKPLAPYSIGSSDANWWSPTGGNFEMICIFRSPSGYWPTQPGCEAPGNDTTIRNQISPDKYGYEAIQANGIHCYNAGWCARFNLYWIDENGALKVYKSKHR